MGKVSIEMDFALDWMRSLKKTRERESISRLHLGHSNVRRSAKKTKDIQFA